MALSTRTRRWIVALAIPLGVVLLWIGYVQDQKRDNYYDCRQSAMDTLHTSLSLHLDQGPEDPKIWVPEWVEDFHDWHTMLAMCEKP
ncbi:MAG: hypothetical protein K0R62_7879 [Nonomuraea muscovyensis]|jgi:hypothetical protein|nr:hypothetical protein [Nonomuraea muscovyensis]